MDRNTIQKILRVFLLACVFIGLKTFNGGLDENNQSKSEV
jgi:hypothetical protein